MSTETRRDGGDGRKRPSTCKIIVEQVTGQGLDRSRRTRIVPSGGTKKKTSTEPKTANRSLVLGKK